MGSIVLVLLAVVLLVAAGVVVLREWHEQGRLNRLGLDDLRRIYRGDHSR